MKKAHAPFDPRKVLAGHPRVRRPLPDFSTHDLTQLTCEAMEALEQLESHAADVVAMVGRWRTGRLQAEDLEPGYEAGAELVWSEPAASSDDAVVNVLPTLYDPQNWQWEENHKPIGVSAMSRDQLLQAYCQLAETLELSRSRIEALARIAQDWKAGTLVPSHLAETTA